MNRGFAIFLIVLVGCGLFGWREYERQMREKVYKNRIKLKLAQQQQKQDQLEELEGIEKEEKTKFKVQIPHDGKPETNTYPMPIYAEGKDEVFVGRIRRDTSHHNAINMWIVADNLRKGAATNTIQIAEYLMANKL